jgi:nucleotide-binding universal stress UspA family protein
VSNTDKVKLKRILVPLDASPHSRAALEAAIQLGASLGAEVSGLYVEDADLLDVCRYPFAMEIGMFSGRQRKLEDAGIERDFQIQADKIRQMMGILSEVSAVTLALLWCVGGGFWLRYWKQAAAADLTVLGFGRDLVYRKRQWFNSATYNKAGTGHDTDFEEGLRLVPPV